MSSEVKKGGKEKMDVATAIRQRRSIRSYREVDVEEDKLKKVLEAARLSPSASNRQEWKFIIIKDKETKRKLAQAAFNQTFIAEAPVVLVACATETNTVMLCGQPAYTVDVSIACAFMVLQAYELGLGTCWIGAFREDEVKRILDIPESVRVVAMTPLGYPRESPPPRLRKRIDQIVCFEKFI